MSNTGSKRVIVGAHYGLKDWLFQRITAVIISVFTMILFAFFLYTDHIDYEAWSGLFANQWMKIFAFLTILSCMYHAWVGMRDIWMDYIASTGIRLFLLTFTGLWLIGSVSYAVQILWRV